jgi:hypothetical protein
VDDDQVIGLLVRRLDDKENPRVDVWVFASVEAMLWRASQSLLPSSSEGQTGNAGFAEK